MVFHPIFIHIVRLAMIALENSAADTLVATASSCHVNAFRLFLCFFHVQVSETDLTSSIHLYNIAHIFACLLYLTLHNVL